MAEQPTVLIMAAGHGTRMRSGLAKVLHPVCGRPMLHWVSGAARRAGAARIICVTRPGAVGPDALEDGVEVVEQLEGEGTGAAVLAARALLEALEPSSTVVVLSGDHPLISAPLIEALAAAHVGEGAAATLLTTEAIDPEAYGRVVRAADRSVERVVETKSTAGVAPEHLAIREVSLGSYAFAAGDLLTALAELPLREGGERQLPDVLPILRERARRIVAHRTRDASSSLGVNTRADLIAVERIARAALIERHALAGVAFAAPDTVVIDAGVTIGADTTVGSGVTLLGSTSIGAGCEIGPHSTLIDARVGDGAAVIHSYLVECDVASGASIGPFAYLRPGADVREGAKVGTFVEVKGSIIGRGAKVPHLSYVGDAEVGEGANVAAGNITANYDGRAKHRTVIEADARTGVNTSFVAPVRVGKGAYTGAGSVITEDVPPGALGIARSRQENIEDYAERSEKEPPE